MQENKTYGNSIKIVSVFLLSAMILIPLIEAFGRRFIGTGIPGASGWVQHLTLWVGLLGAILATIKGNHLSISVTQLINSKETSSLLQRINEICSIAILLILVWASIELVYFQYDSPENIGGWFPVWLAQATMPVTFVFMTIITFRKFIVILTLSGKNLLWLILVTVTLTLFIWLDFTTGLLIALIVLSLTGMPIYIILAGIALLLFNLEDLPFAALPAATYDMVTQPVLPSIPLFALAGTILAAGGAPKRLMRLVNAWMAWMPGGVAISSIISCAFFTAITGASGVTILALGGILLPVLIAGKYSEKFSTGLLTASGSVGLLFPPSLPVILYGVYAHVAIDKLFLAAFIPGLILITMLISGTLIWGGSSKESRSPFNMQEALKSTSAAMGDLLLPVIVIAGFFGGIITIVETAALTALWAIILETFIYRKIDLKKDLPTSMVESAGLIGALLIVLGMALGLVSYLVDAQIPYKAADWVTSIIETKWIFLLVLNAMLLLVGALMDIFSAIVIVVPLLVPVGMAFGIDPVHLGVIFLANLELGYLTPPIGMNLFLSSLRFNKPLLAIWKTVFPFLIIFVLWVLMITYVPWLSVRIGSLF
jgi:tripartite ATP-independent transporter DctM subunit